MSNNYDFQVQINGGKFVPASKAKWAGVKLQKVVVRSSIADDEYIFDFNQPSSVEAELNDYIDQHSNWAKNKFDPVSIMVNLSKTNKVQEIIKARRQAQQDQARQEHQAQAEGGAQSIGEVFSRQSTYQPELLASRALMKYILFPIVSPIVFLSYLKDMRDKGLSLVNPQDQSLGSVIMRVTKAVMGVVIISAGAAILMATTGIAPAWLAVARNIALFGGIASFLSMNVGLLFSDMNKNPAAREFATVFGNYIGYVFKEVTPGGGFQAQPQAEYDAEMAAQSSAAARAGAAAAQQPRRPEQ